MSNLQKIIVAGSRSINDYDILDDVLTQLTSGDMPREMYEIVSGGARGVDSMAKKWADRNDCGYTEFEPDWDQFGKAAGPIRNKKMAEYASPGGWLVAIWDGESKGTKNMIDNALEAGLTIHVYQPHVDEYMMIR